MTLTSAPNKIKITDSNNIRSAKLAINKMTLLAPRTRSCLYINWFIDIPTKTEKNNVTNEENQKGSPIPSNKKNRKYIDKSKVEPCAK